MRCTTTVSDLVLTSPPVSSVFPLSQLGSGSARGGCARVEQTILDRLDLAAWKRAEVVEQAERESLTNILANWPGISGQASKCEERQP